MIDLGNELASYGAADDRPRSGRRMFAMGRLRELVADGFCDNEAQSWARHDKLVEVDMP